MSDAAPQRHLRLVNAAARTAGAAAGRAAQPAGRAGRLPRGGAPRGTVYFGAGAYGVQVPAQRYFGRDAAELSLGQAAIVVGLVKNPNGYNPIEYREIAQDRRDTVLWRMLQQGYIDQDRFDEVAARKLKVHPTEADNGCTDSDYPLCCDYVREKLAADPALGATQEARDYALYVGGLTV